jgi:hypothetical protein
MGCLVEIQIVGEFTGLSASPEFMSIETPGGIGIAHKRSYPGEFNPDSQDNFGTTYPGDILQDRSASGPIFLASAFPTQNN